MASGVAILLILFGVPGLIWPYKMARFEEQLDAIGSKRSWSEVEPADWKVSLTRITSAGIVLFGTSLLVSSI